MPEHILQSQTLAFNNIQQNNHDQSDSKKHIFSNSLES